MQNSIEDHDLLSLIEDLPMSGKNSKREGKAILLPASQDAGKNKIFWSTLHCPTVKLCMMTGQRDSIDHKQILKIQSRKTNFIKKSFLAKLYPSFEENTSGRRRNPRRSSHGHPGGAQGVHNHQ
jgi:hypothetical protein